MNKFFVSCLISMILFCIPAAAVQPEYEYYMDNVQTITFDKNYQEVCTWTAHNDSSITISDNLLHITSNGTTAAQGITQGIPDGDKTVLSVRFRFNELSDRGLQLAIYRPNYRAVVRINADNIEYRNGDAGFSAVGYAAEKNIWYTARLSLELFDADMNIYRYSLELKQDGDYFEMLFDNASVQAFDSPRNYVSILTEDKEQTADVSVEKIIIANGYFAGSEYYFRETFAGEDALSDNWMLKDEKSQISVKDGIVAYNMKSSLIARITRKLDYKSNDLVLTFDACLEYNTQVDGTFLGIQLYTGEKRAFLQIMPDKFRIQPESGAMLVYSDFPSESGKWYSYRITKTGDYFKVERKAVNEDSYHVIAENIAMKIFQGDASLAFYCEKIGCNAFLKNVSVNAVFGDESESYFPQYTVNCRAKTESELDYADRQIISFNYSLRDDIEFNVYHNGKNGCVKITENYLSFTDGTKVSVVPVKSRNGNIYSARLICNKDGTYSMERSIGGKTNVIFCDARLTDAEPNKNGYKVVRATSSVSGITAKGEKLSDFYDIASAEQVNSANGFFGEKDKNIIFSNERMLLSCEKEVEQYIWNPKMEIPSYIMTFSVDASGATSTDYLSLGIGNGRMLFEKDRLLIVDSEGKGSEFLYKDKACTYRIESSIGYIDVFRINADGSSELLTEKLYIGSDIGEMKVEKYGNISVADINLTRTEKHTPEKKSEGLYGYCTGINLPEKCKIPETENSIFIGDYELRENGNVKLLVATAGGNTEITIDESNVSFTSFSGMKIIPLKSSVGVRYTLRIEVVDGECSLLRKEHGYPEFGIVFIGEDIESATNELSVEAVVNSAGLYDWICSNGGISAYAPEVIYENGERYLKFNIIDSASYLRPEAKPMDYIILIAGFSDGVLTDMIAGDNGMDKVPLSENIKEFKTFVWNSSENMLPISDSYVMEVEADE